MSIATPLGDKHHLIATYSGDGTLKGRLSEQGVGCLFEAGQLSSGDIILRCSFRTLEVTRLGPMLDEQIQFTGTTEDGTQLSADGVWPPHRKLVHGSESEVEFYVRRLHALVATNQVQSVRYGITNFEFIGTETVTRVTERSQHSYLELPLTLESSGTVIKALIERIGGYVEKIERISAIPRGVDVTCEAVVDLTNGQSIESIDTAISNLCEVMSVARGTRINWIYRDTRDASGDLQSRVHHSHITRTFQVMPMIDDGIRSADVCRSYSDELPLDRRYATKTFFEEAYRTFTSDPHRQELYKRIINAYLDARPEDRFLEARAIAFALVMEVINHAAPELLDLPNRGNIIDKKSFRHLSDQVEACIDEAVSDEEARDRMKSKLGELNRLSFRTLMQALAAQIELPAKNAEIDLFIKSRNSLVHSGQFYCLEATPEERDKTAPLETPIHEYFFLVNFLDRVLLRMLGYHGHYIDWRVPGQPCIDLI